MSKGRGRNAIASRVSDQYSLIVDRLRARIRELEGALRPFAEERKKAREHDVPPVNPIVDYDRATDALGGGGKR